MSDPLLVLEHETFQNNKDNLLANHQGKYVLICQSELHVPFGSEQDAIARGYELFGNVPFLVKLIARFEVGANFVNHNTGV